MLRDHAKTGPAGDLTSPAGTGVSKDVGNRAQRTRAAKRTERQPFLARLRRDWQLLLMALPAIGLLIVFHYVPLLGNVIAFQDYSPYVGIADSPWVGFSNFQWLMFDESFWDATLNTLAITTFQLVFYFPVPILLAVLLDSVVRPRLRLFIQGIVYMPHFFSWVLVVTLFQQMFGGAGLLSQTLRDHGYRGIDIMTNPDTFLVLVTAETIWKDAGWGTIIFLAALAAINQNLYEAAAVDGANRWRRMWHITLPGLRPVVVLLLILRLGEALNVGFEQFFLQRDAVGRDAAEVLDTFVYWRTLLTGEWSYGAAAGLVKGLVGLILILMANKVAHRFGEQGIYKRS
ncbi:putative aldouronate transport system permease protein [Streptosporangium becharense]|uniref:Putative aldouronate transport system permease protein n=1 Tax=Streptosporangium becharense TaxID=1816182 RepID=A0A7W9IFA1_9ACTN|nr:ABC transporter permease subunit [Streptosporangium becharense]MBB2909619.1 putative aldouronate transport system permease protein [Streptosporangium becharense]MBB5819425.1 putative aldouronate transport system permease protein [Streptosporangium becharense]